MTKWPEARDGLHADVRIKGAHISSFAEIDFEWKGISSNLTSSIWKGSAEEGIGFLALFNTAASIGS